jgi:sulfoacetaldehyde dehydrogenase
MVAPTTSALARNPASQIVAGLVERARAAQKLYAAYSQERLDEVVTAAGWAIMEPERNRTLAELAVKDTGLGNVTDKIVKNHRKTLGLLRDLQHAVSTGIIADYPESGITEIARPWRRRRGRAVDESRRDASQQRHQCAEVRQRRDSVAVAQGLLDLRPARRLHPRRACARRRTAGSRANAAGAGNPGLSTALMQQADLVVVTGSQNNVRAGYSSGTPALGVGAGNVAVIVDESADTNDAAAKIMLSKTFDNATSCSSENSLIIHAGVYDEMLNALRREGGALLTAAEKATLQKAMFPGGKLSPAITAQSVSKICAVAGLTRPELVSSKCLLVEETGTGRDFPFSGEKLSPVLTLLPGARFRSRIRSHARDLRFHGRRTFLRNLFRRRRPHSPPWARNDRVPRDRQAGACDSPTAAASTMGCPSR